MDLEASIAREKTLQGLLPFCSYCKKVGDDGDYGIYITNLSAPTVKNNIVEGFETGIYAEHDLSNNHISYNNLWDQGTQMFDGSAMPPLIGDMVDSNANEDDSDIYGNISYDPGFVSSSDYSLAEDSVCIDAGDPSILDDDGTVSDIGAR